MVTMPTTHDDPEFPPNLITGPSPNTGPFFPAAKLSVELALFLLHLQTIHHTISTSHRETHAHSFLKTVSPSRATIGHTSAIVSRSASLLSSSVRDHADIHTTDPSRSVASHRVRLGQKTQRNTVRYDTMVDAAPRTPTPSSRTLRRQHDPDNNTTTTTAGAPQSSAALTPPPTDKKARHSFSTRATDPVSPTKAVFAPIMSMTHTRTGSFGNSMPTASQIQSMPLEHLRTLATDLIPSLGEARMELAHTKLQYQLLSIETREAAERAEVEHEMTRKEVEVLQAGSPILQNRALISPDPRSLVAQVQGQLEAAVARGAELEVSNEGLETRLLDAKRLIRVLDGRNMELSEENVRLRERIRENREHLDAMRASGLIRSAPSSPRLQSAGQGAPAGGNAHGINHYATPARPRRSEVQRVPATPVSRIASTVTPSTARPTDDPFGALLFASEIIDAQHQRASVPSTPSPTRTMRQPPSHTRGTHSLSSLPVTPRKARLQHETKLIPATSHAHAHPHAAAHGSRRHSVSTISDSSSQDDLADAHQTSSLRRSVQADEEMPASQASQAASDLLRRYPGTTSQSQSQERPSSGLGFIQTKLTGKVVKGNKRSYGERKASAGSPKKQKTAPGAKGEIGLGIGMWGSPRR